MKPSGNGSGSQFCAEKDISGLDYIRIPDTLTCPDTQDERILKEWHTIEALKEKKILNLSGFTNTDLNWNTVSAT